MVFTSHWHTNKTDICSLKQNRTWKTIELECMLIQINSMSQQLSYPISFPRLGVSPPANVIIESPWKLDWGWELNVYTAHQYLMGRWEKLHKLQRTLYFMPRGSKSWLNTCDGMHLWRLGYTVVCVYFYVVVMISVKVMPSCFFPSSTQSKPRLGCKNCLTPLCVDNLCLRSCNEASWIIITGILLRIQYKCRYVTVAFENRWQACQAIRYLRW